MRRSLLLIIIRHGISVREFTEMKAKYYFAKTQKNNPIYIDGFIEKHKIA
jgi:hypothetical protein